MGNNARSGQKLKIKASDWNELLQAKDAILRGSGEGSFSAPQARSSGVITIKNTTASAFPSFHAVGLDVPVILPADNDKEFRRVVQFDAVVPEAGTHEGIWAVCLAPIGPGKLGSALVAGVCQVRVTGAAQDFVEIQDASTVLAMSATGTARVLWAESGTGERWAIVRVEAGGAGGITVEEVDGSPSYSAINDLQFDQADGFVVSQPSAGKAKVKLTYATTNVTIVTGCVDNVPTTTTIKIPTAWIV